MLVNYACHCTTLGGEFNKICAEWAGYACDDDRAAESRRDRTGDHRLRGGRQPRAPAESRRREEPRGGPVA